MAPLPGNTSRTSGASARVLVVDDHRNTRESLALGLASPDIEVSTAASGEEALEALAAGAWDWLVCDVRMPGMSGIELAARARALSPALGLVLMTAFDVSAEERRRIVAMNADLLIKPVTADFLADGYVQARPASRQ